MIHDIHFFTDNLRPGVLADFEGRLDSTEPYHVRGQIVDSIRDGRPRVMWPTNGARRFFATPADRDATAREDGRILDAWRNWRAERLIVCAA